MTIWTIRVIDKLNWQTISRSWNVAFRMACNSILHVIRAAYVITIIRAFENINIMHRSSIELAFA